MDKENIKKIHSLNESTLRSPLVVKKFYVDRDFYLAYPMSHTARSFIDESLEILSKSKRLDLIDRIDVAQVEITCGIYLLDSCGTSFSPLKNVTKPKVEYLVSDEPFKAFKDSGKILLNFADRKVASEVQKNIEEFRECYEYLRRNVFSFDFRHSELRSMMDVFSNSLHDYWRSYIDNLIEEKKLLKGSTPSHIFWGYNQFAVPYDIQVKRQKKSLENAKKILSSRAEPGGFSSVSEMKEQNRKAKARIIKNEVDNKKKSKEMYNSLIKELDIISQMGNSRERNSQAYAWVDKYKKYLSDFFGKSEEEAEDNAIQKMEQKVFFQ